MNSAAIRKSHKAGYTLIETLVAIVVLTIMMVGVFREINKAQGYYKVEGAKVDVTQPIRQFIDTFTRDLHQAGFPTLASVGPGNAAAQGLTAFSNTSLTFDGDLDGTGNIQTVTYTYDAAGCACITRTAGGAPSTAIEQLTAASFTGYDASGAPTTTPASIRSIEVSVTMQNGVDPSNRAPVQLTMTGMARLPNND
jgi:prepilin-type N-terminal cleavage/methylation domain-containing protein